MTYWRKPVRKFDDDEDTSCHGKKSSIPGWVILAVGAVCTIGALIAYNYWVDCFDLGIFKVCTAVKKPF